MDLDESKFMANLKSTSEVDKMDVDVNLTSSASSNVQNQNPEHHFNAICYEGTKLTSQSEDSWLVRAPQPIRAGRSVKRTCSQDNAILRSGGVKTKTECIKKFSFIPRAEKSAFVPSSKTGGKTQATKTLMEDNNILKRCNSAPLPDAMEYVNCFIFLKPTRNILVILTFIKTSRLI